VSVVIYLSAVWSFVMSLKDPYAIIGWSMASFFTAVFAFALRSERLNGEGTSFLRGYSTPLFAAALIPVAYTCWCFVIAIKLQDNLSPPYDKNHWLGGIAANVASVWAIRIAVWAGQEQKEIQFTVDHNERTTGLLSNRDFA